MKTPVTTAIIAASGFNTRRLPVSAAFPKEFMPIGNRPALDFVVDDLVRAGITTIYIVIHPFHRELYERYFIGNAALDDHLRRTGKTAELEGLQQLRLRASVHLLEDHTKSRGLYGSTTPLMAALEQVTEPAFIYAGAEDFTVRRDGGSDLVDLVAAFQEQSADGAVLGRKVPLAKLKSAGVLTVHKDDPSRLSHLVEKPAHPEELPEPRLANISKYLFTAAIAPFVAASKVNPRRGEYEITDVIDAFAAKHRVVVCAATGDYYDAGSLDNWLTANDALADHNGEG